MHLGWSGDVVTSDPLVIWRMISSASSFSFIAFRSILLTASSAAIISLESSSSAVNMLSTRPKFHKSYGEHEYQAIEIDFVVTSTWSLVFTGVVVVATMN